MITHDKMCDYWRRDLPCQCDFIRAVRADQVARTLQAAREVLYWRYPSSGAFVVERHKVLRAVESA